MHAVPLSWNFLPLSPRFCHESFFSVDLTVPQTAETETHTCRLRDVAYISPPPVIMPSINSCCTYNTVRDVDLLNSLKLSTDLQCSSEAAVRKLNISHINWDNDEEYLRLFLPCHSSLHVAEVRYAAKCHDDGSTEITLFYPGFTFNMHTCNQISLPLESCKKSSTLIIRFGKIYPKDHWSFLSSRDYHSDGKVTIYINNIFKQTFSLNKIQKYLPSSPLFSLENILVAKHSSPDVDVFGLMLDEIIAHESADLDDDLLFTKVTHIWLFSLNRHLFRFLLICYLLPKHSLFLTQHLWLERFHQINSLSPITWAFTFNRMAIKCSYFFQILFASAISREHAESVEHFPTAAAAQWIISTHQQL